MDEWMNGTTGVVRRVGKILLVIVAVALAGARVGAQECKGDFDEDGRVSIDELVTAVNSALRGCDLSTAHRQGCINSGGVVTTTSCCTTQGDFPNTCSIGQCGCSPELSHEVETCDCPDGKCFHPSQSTCVVR